MSLMHTQIRPKPQMSTFFRAAVMAPLLAGLILSAAGCRYRHGEEKQGQIILPIYERSDKGKDGRVDVLTPKNLPEAQKPASGKAQVKPPTSHKTKKGDGKKSMMPGKNQQKKKQELKEPKEPGVLV